MNLDLFINLISEFIEKWRQEHPGQPVNLIIQPKNKNRIDLIGSDNVGIIKNISVAMVVEKRDTVRVEKCREGIELLSYFWIYELLFDLQNHIFDNVLSPESVYPIKPPLPDLNGKSKGEIAEALFIYYDVMHERKFEFTLEEIAKLSDLNADYVRQLHAGYKAEHGLVEPQ
jgi:hypothetical protein